MKNIFNKNIYDLGKTKKNKGMTLVELMVCLSIFIIVTGLTIFDYGSFRSNVSIQNLATDISLAIRKAQGYAIGALGKDQDFERPFGIHFSVNKNTPSVEGSYKSFVLFTDLDDKGFYDIPSNGICEGECVEVFNIESNDVIEEIHYYTNGGDDYTLDMGSNSLDILFKRPNPDGIFCMNNGVYCDGLNGYSISSIRITVSNNQSGDNRKTKTISVSNTGQISVE
jgi:prepilin-type N-terminal cleavage/methylation domain-containing protein